MWHEIGMMRVISSEERRRLKRGRRKRVVEVRVMSIRRGKKTMGAFIRTVMVREF